MDEDELSEEMEEEHDDEWIKRRYIIVDGNNLYYIEIITQLILLD